MKRTDLAVVVAAVVAIGGLGWLATSFLTTGDEPAPVEEVAERPDRPLDREVTPEPFPEDPPVVERIGQEPPVIEIDDEPPLPAGLTGTISGRVVNKGKNAVEGAEVELLRVAAVAATMPELGTPTGLKFITDESGSFQLTGVEPGGDYSLVVRHKDYSNTQIGPISLAAEEVKQVADVILKKGVLVFGTVGRGGRPIEGAEILLRSTPMPNFGRQPPPERKELPPIFSGQDGGYRFEAVPMKNFELIVVADGFARAIHTSQPLMGGLPEREINFEMLPAMTITGRVTDASGLPVQGASIIATQQQSALDYRCTAETEAGQDGAFIVEDIGEGRYHLYAQCDGFSPEQRNNITAGTTNVSIEMKPQGAVSGLVTDEATGKPVFDFTITVLRPTRGSNPPGRTRVVKQFETTDGSFTLGGLDPRSYLLEARARGYAPSLSAEFPVVRGEMAVGVEVKMNYGGSVSGRVLGSDKKPVVGVMVSINPNESKNLPILRMFEALGGGQKPRRTRTAEDGSFAIKLVVPGIYQINFEHSDYASLPMDHTEIVKNVEQDLGVVTMSRGGTVMGLALGTSGDALPGASVAVHGSDQEYFETIADGDGHFEIGGLRPGDYNISITRDPTAANENPFEALLTTKKSTQTFSVVADEKIEITLQINES